MTSYITALYRDPDTAQEVVQRLMDAGYDPKNISLVSYDASKKEAVTTHGDDDVKSGQGARFGAITGALVGLGAMVIPGIGPVIAAGPLVAGLLGAGVGAAAGAATGSISASLVKSGVDEETANYYTEGIRRGGTLVSVMADDGQVDQALKVMNQYNPIDVKTEGAKWKESGWSAQDEQPQSTQQTTAGERQMTSTPRPAGDEARAEVVQEELQVGKREVERGGVRVHTHVTETPVQEQINLREEHVDVERRPVNRAATDADFANDEMTYEVTEK